MDLAGEHAVILGQDDPAFALPEFDDSDWRRIAVPSSLRAAGLPARPDVFWYRLSFRLPADWAEPAPALRLGIVTRSDETYLNGVLIGGHGIVGPANSDWHVYAPTMPRLYPVDPGLLRPGEVNVIAIRGAREPYIDDGGIIAGPVALVSLEAAWGAYDALQTRFVVLRSLVLGVETLVALVLVAFLVLGEKSRLILLFQLLYLPSYFFFLEHRGALALLGFETQALQFAANISGALALPVLLELVARIFGHPMGMPVRLLQAGSLVALFSVPASDVPFLSWWAVESNLVWHALMGCALVLATAWSLRAYLSGARYSGAMMVGLTGLFLGISIDLVFPLNYFEQRIGLRIAELGILGLFLSITVIVLQSILDRERNLMEANAAIGRLHEQDRARMARDVHDGLGQWLGAIKIKLGLLHQQAGGAKAELGGLQADINQAIDDTRRLAHDLAPALLEEMGLIGAMASNAEHFRPIFDVHFDSVGDSEMALAKAAQIHVYRIFQEALSNAARHSGATEVAVQIAQSASHFSLEVEDNGRWAGQSGVSTGLGLQSMFSRAQVMGGALKVSHPEGSGTRVSLVIPIASGAGHG